MEGCTSVSILVHTALGKKNKKTKTKTKNNNNIISEG